MSNIKFETIYLNYKTSVDLHYFSSLSLSLDFAFLYVYSWIHDISGLLFTVPEI